MYKEKYEKFRKSVDFIESYRGASNAATGSKYDANANVEHKNITTCAGELVKGEKIGTNRLLMIDKITQMYGGELAEEYIRQLENHEIYKHDETSIAPYCVSITMYPFLLNGLGDIGGVSSAPTNLESYCGSFINLVFAVAAQFAGAVATPEFLLYMDYFVRKDYGDDYINHLDDIVSPPFALRQRTLKQTIEDKFQQIVYSISQPAAARDYQSCFWNIAYFDHYYYKGMFGEFLFPDDTEPIWETFNWLQKDFMKWFNKEQTKKVLTFPVQTVNLLNDGTDAVDQEWLDFASEMYAEGAQFFTYTSDSVDSLASCCFSGKQMCLSKSSEGVNLMTFEDLYNANYDECKKNFTVFHNGSWVNGKVIRLPKRPMYKIVTANKKEMVVTDNHIFPTLKGDKRADELTTEDLLLFNSRRLDTFPERDRGLTYEEGYLIGMYLGDGSMDNEENNYTPTTRLSLNKEKFSRSATILEQALSQIGEEKIFTLGKPYNNVYPLRISSWVVYNFIRDFVSGRYCHEKELNMDCLLQSYKFRRGILDGYYLTDGGNSNRIYTTSEKLTVQIETLITSLGFNSVIDVTDRTNETVVIRGAEYQRNYPLYCIRWYDPKNKRTANGGAFKVVNNCEYYKITLVEPVEYDDEYVYCFEMKNEDEPYFTLPNGVITHNCRLRNEVQDNTFSYTLGAGGVSTGSKGVLTTNINRLVQNATREGKDISEAVREQVLKNHKYLIAFNEIIRDSFNSRMLPIYDAGFIDMDKQFLTQGINGFVEGAEFLGIEISPNEEYFKYGEMILKPIFEENRKAKTEHIMFNTEFVPAENLGVKNAKWDKEDGYVVPRDCYNSYFYIVESGETSIVDKFILHGKRLTKYLDGGSALHGNLMEHLTKEQYIKLFGVAVKTGCSYYTWNVKNTVCNKCGYVSKHTLKSCPRCSSHDLDYTTRIIGYTKRISSFSEARQKEEGRRNYGSYSET